MIPRDQTIFLMDTPPLGWNTHTVALLSLLEASPSNQQLLIPAQEWEAVVSLVQELFHQAWEVWSDLHLPLCSRAAPKNSNYTSCRTSPVGGGK